MADYTTTNLRLTKGTYEELRYKARRRGTSVAMLVREAVAQYLGRDQAEVIPFGEDPVDRLIGSIDGDGPTDESVNHDHYLYGWPKESERDDAGGHGSATGLPLTKRPAPRTRGSGIRD